MTGTNVNGTIVVGGNSVQIDFHRNATVRVSVACESLKQKIGKK